MSENEIKIITEENNENEEMLHQKIIFDNTIFEQIKGKELDLSVEKIFDIPKIKSWFKIQKEEYYVVSQREHVIDKKVRKIKRTKIDKKVRKIWKKLKPLYMEYKLLQLTKARNDKKDHLINIISKAEYKYVCYLKKQYE